MLFREHSMWLNGEAVIFCDQFPKGGAYPVNADNADRDFTYINRHKDMQKVSELWRLPSFDGGDVIKNSAKLDYEYVKPEKQGQRGQCLHCLRHKFAVKSFAAAEANGRPTADSVPYVSVYLGHFDMDGTEKYLKFSSDIFPEHTEMFAAYAAGVFSVLGGDVYES